MSELGVKVVVVLLILVSIPFMYIDEVIIGQLSQRIGFVKRWLIVFSCIAVFAFAVYLLSKGVIGFGLFILTPVIIQLIGVVYFRDEIRSDIKRICSRLKK